MPTTQPHTDTPRVCVALRPPVGCLATHPWPFLPQVVGRQGPDSLPTRLAIHFDEVGGVVPGPFRFIRPGHGWPRKNEIGLGRRGRPRQSMFDLSPEWTRFE